MGHIELPSKYGQPTYRLTVVSYDYAESENKRSINLINTLLTHWESALSAVLVGIILSALIAWSIPSTYVLDAQLAKPYASDLVALNTKGSLNASPEEVFHRAIDTLQSRTQFNNFANQSARLKKLFPLQHGEVSNEKLISQLWDNFAVHKQYASDSKEGVNSLNRITINIKGKSESDLAEFLNDYIHFTADSLLEEKVTEQKEVITLALADIQRKISVFRSNAATNRELEIARILENNQIKIKSLQQEINSLIDKAGEDRNTRIAELEEALGIARNMKIDSPTTIEAFNRLRGKRGIVAKINFKAVPKSPIFLMGTKFLTNEIEKLNSRENDAFFAEKVNELQRQKTVLENDQMLAALQQRKTDDPYIKELPILLAEKNRLESLSLNFSQTQLFRIEAPANADGIEESPNRALVSILGLLLSIVLVLSISAMTALIAQTRKLQNVHNPREVYNGTPHNLLS